MVFVDDEIDVRMEAATGVNFVILSKYHQGGYTLRLLDIVTLGFSVFGLPT